MLAAAGLIFLSFTVHHSARPDEKVYDIIDDDNANTQSLTSDFSWSSIPPSRTLRWHPCFDDGKFDCARLDLPKDWLDPSDDDRVILAIARLPASSSSNNEDYRGPVFFNPGGPGGSGIWSLRDHGAYLQTIIGTNHDLISFDPRGIGASIPRIECWGAAEKRHNWALQKTPVIDAYPGAFYDAWARASAFSQACEERHATRTSSSSSSEEEESNLLQHIGTPSHARDLLAILDLLGENKLRYWGFSYGTILGGTFAALYPDRVGRLVSDGNVDYQEWYNSAHVNAIRDADTVMDAFYALCHDAGPSKCAFWGSSPQDIKKRHAAILDRLRVNPVIHMPALEEQVEAALPEVITYSKLRQLTATSLYRPNYYFPHLATILAGLEKGDGTPYFKFVTQFGLPFPSVCLAEDVPPTVPLTSENEGTDDAFPTILCADGKPLGDDPQKLESWLGEMEALSETAGAIVAADRIACAGRTVRPKWELKDSFGTDKDKKETAFPILYIANMADNITPLVSARNNSAGFAGSVVLVQNSYGVSSRFLSH